MNNSRTNLIILLTKGTAVISKSASDTLKISFKKPLGIQNSDQ